jgi:hypothetical protein
VPECEAQDRAVPKSGLRKPLFSRKKTMSDVMIPSPPEEPDPKSSKQGKDKNKSRPSGDEKAQRPKASRPRADRIPDAAEIVAELKKLMGLSLIGIVSLPKANMLFRCISKIADIAMRSSPSGHVDQIQDDLVQACRENPKVLDLVAPFLTEDLLDNVMRQLSDGDDA